MNTPRIFPRLQDLSACVGQRVATTGWTEVTQAQVNQFAHATHDLQWIHIDEERARQGPFGAPIAHGFLTLSLLSKFFGDALHVQEARMGVNYGLNKVRFPAPVPVGSRLRAHLDLRQATDIEGGMQFVWEVQIEREGADKPVCVAESLVRLYT